MLGLKCSPEVCAFFTFRYVPDTLPLGARLSNMWVPGSPTCGLWVPGSSTCGCPAPEYVGAPLPDLRVP